MEEVSNKLHHLHVPIAEDDHSEQTCSLAIKNIWESVSGLVDYIRNAFKISREPELHEYPFPPCSHF